MDWKGAQGPMTAASQAGRMLADSVGYSLITGRFANGDDTTRRRHDVGPEKVALECRSRRPPLAGRRLESDQPDRQAALFAVGLRVRLLQLQPAARSRSATW